MPKRTKTPKAPKPAKNTPKPATNFYESKLYGHLENTLPEFPKLYATLIPEIQRIYDANGQPNSKYIDHLKSTPCINCAELPWDVFVMNCPYTILKQQHFFKFEEFVRHWPFLKSMDTMQGFLTFISIDYKINVNELLEKFEDFVSVEQKMLLQFGVEHEFDMFVERFQTELETKFKTEYCDTFTTHSFKKVGSFPTEAEADKAMRFIEATTHGTHFTQFKGQGGDWLIFDPKQRQVQSTTYQQEEANQLYKINNLNHETRAEAFETRKTNRIREQLAKNQEIAEKTGQKVTQTMTEDGQIISGDRRKLIESDERIEVRPTASKLKDNILDQFESVSMNYTVNGKEVSTLGTRAPTSTF